MGTHLIKTPICVYNRQILFVPTTHIFFSKINPLNTANGHFSVSHVTNSHILSNMLHTDSGYLHTVFSYHVLIIVGLIPCLNTYRFLWVNTMLLL